MKRIFLIFLCLTLLGTLCACRVRLIADPAQADTILQAQQEAQPPQEEEPQLPAQKESEPPEQEQLDLFTDYSLDGIQGEESMSMSM